MSNIDDVVVTFNDLLQLDLGQASSDLTRVAINSTVGLGGMFNVAGNVFDLEKHDEDFGQTLAHWGVQPGPYLVLPFLGPSTLRESGGVWVDSIVNPSLRMDDQGARDKILTFSALDSRVALLKFDKFIIGDEYIFIQIKMHKL